MPPRVAALAPRPRGMKSVEEIVQELNLSLSQQFCLEPLSHYTVVTEGWTDVAYLKLAARLASESTGVDLLCVDYDDETRGQIDVVTPGIRGNPARGGVPQVVRLAEAIAGACFVYGAYAGVALLFDHDDAGVRAMQEVQGYGFRHGKHSLTLDPQRHPSTKAKKQVVIEDLLSLDIQTRFFQQGIATCSVSYDRGDLTRYVWGFESKRALQEYVESHAKWLDVVEVTRVLVRVREMWGLPVDASLYTAIGASSQTSAMPDE